MVSQNGYWLEMKIETKDNPLLKIKNEFKDEIYRVTPYIQPKGKIHLIDIELKNCNDLPKLRFAINTKYETKGNMQYVPGSERIKSEEASVYCWIKNPSFDLIQECLLIGYELLPGNPSEHFLVFHKDKDFLLEDVLRKGIEKIEGGIEALENKLDWFISDTMSHPRPSFFTLFQTYKFNNALHSNFFNTYNVDLLSPLIKDIYKATGQEYDKTKLTEELRELEQMLTKYILSK